MSRKPSKAIPEWARRGRSLWQWDGSRRPPFALTPEPHQESVWDYPRPPRLVAEARAVRVEAEGVVLAQTRRALRLLETASPPTFYLPPEDVDRDRLASTGTASRCEWKGAAEYFDVVLPEVRLPSAAWSYAQPFAPFEELAGYVSFYPAILQCYVDDERVLPQPGGFYGGWLTSDVCGPFKGEPGTAGW